MQSENGVLSLAESMRSALNKAGILLADCLSFH